MTERDALQTVVDAWEALPMGFYDARTVQRWMSEKLKPAIDQARMVLTDDKRAHTRPEQGD